VFIPAFLAAHFITMALCLVVLIICLIYLVRAPHFAMWQKVMWATLLLLATVVMTPVFIWWQIQPVGRETT